MRPAAFTADLDDPVGKHLRETFISLAESSTVIESLAQLRGSQLPEQIVYFYVVDPDRRLVGVIPTRRLLMAAPEARIGDLCVRKVVALPPHATVMDACEMFMQHRFLALPVVDADKRLMGIVDVGLFTDELLESHEKDNVDELFQLIGVHVAAARPTSTWNAFATRFPWLIANIGAGLLCAVIAGWYEHTLASVVTIALFIPVVLALSESVSIQSMTITLQALHGQRPKFRAAMRAVAAEGPTAALLGTACGAIVGGVAWAWRGDGLIAAAIG
ncbi:MAG TPA: CBS domain-containing protein, partial [Planctomycetota bacterium]|nr:CBS domain-containing protein [Planctomycetota bacterium]